MNAFLDKLKQNKTKLQIVEENDGKIIRIHVIHDDEYDMNCLQRIYYDNEIDIGIVFETECMERDMKTHKKTLDYLLNNHEGIKKRLGGRLFRSDNISFKNLILKTEEKLDTLLNKFSETNICV